MKRAQITIAKTRGPCGIGQNYEEYKLLRCSDAGRKGKI